MAHPTEAVAAAFHRFPNVPYFVWWGRLHQLATALKYALEYSDPAMVGAPELLRPVGVQGADGGQLCSWRSGGALPCMLNPRGPPQVLCQQYLYLSVRGLVYLLLIS